MITPTCLPSTSITSTVIGMGGSHLELTTCCIFSSSNDFSLLIPITLLVLSSIPITKYPLPPLEFAIAHTSFASSFLPDSEEISSLSLKSNLIPSLCCV